MRNVYQQQNVHVSDVTVDICMREKYLIICIKCVFFSIITRGYVYIFIFYTNPNLSVGWKKNGHTSRNNNLPIHLIERKTNGADKRFSRIAVV